MHPLQEKFQVIVPGKETGDEPWASFESARSAHGRHDAANTEPTYSMPPGMDGSNTLQPFPLHMPLSMAGETDVSMDTNLESFDCGFKKRPMKGTDDQYTGEHVDHFYGDAGGFVERNNYLDRE